MKKQKKLMWKVFVYLLGFCLILLAVIWFFETTLLDRMYKSVRRTEIRNAIDLVEKNIDSPELSNILYDLEERSEIIVAKESEFNLPKKNHMGHMGPGHKGNLKAREVITQTHEFTREDGSKISLVFYGVISPVNATISTIKTQLFYVTIIMVILAIILAYIIAKSVSTPIENINESAKKLASGNYDTVFIGDGYSEIVELSDTLNYAAAELSKVDNLRKELMANVSHDLRTPLALIYSYAEMMHDFPGEITNEQTEVIMTETRRLSKLVNDIFDVSQIETGNYTLKKDNYNLNDSIKSIIESVVELTKNDGFNIDFTSDGNYYIYADEVKIGQAFYNLLINAIHYSGESRKIHVILQKHENIIRVEVMDHGDGIAKSELNNIWDRYYKSKTAHRRAKIGTGLGLSIVKKIIDLHAGNYGVESELGNGSTFWFEIPIE